jgi:hypothetical protein
LETKIRSERALYRRLRAAGILSIAGLVIEILSFFWLHPLAFVAFLVLGCGFIGLGIAIFLWSLVGIGTTPPPATDQRSRPAA